MIALELSSIRKDYGTVTVLDGVDLAVAVGEVHAIVGENGAGKSTLLNIISGVTAPTNGTMKLRGKPVLLERLGPTEAQGLGVTVVHQEFSLLPAMTVAENVFLGREPRRWGMVDRRRILEMTAELLTRLGSRISPTANVETLSVAGAQIVELAKALSIDARVIAMDEPSAVLSGQELDQLFEVVNALSAQGVAILYVSHRLDEVFEICDRYTVLRDGRVTGHGDISDITQRELVTLMVGREVSQVFPRPANPPGNVRLHVRNFDIAGLAAPVSFEARAGEIVGLVGLNGAGRTTLLKGLFGADWADGQVQIDGDQYPKGFARTSDAMKAGLAFLPEDRKVEGLALRKPVRSNLTLNVLRRMAGRWGISGPRERDFTENAVGDLDIRTMESGSALAGTLSGGNQQKVVLGKWLAGDPRVLILDEPTRGVDVGSKEQIYDRLRALADDGTILLIASSELVEIIGLSDRLLVMADGRIVGELSHDEATEERILQMITSASAHGGVR